MRLKTGLWLLAVVSLFGLAGCGGGGSSANTSGATKPSSTPTLVSIAVSPSGNSIVLGKTQQFTATGTYSDGSSKNLTSSVVWSSSASTVVSITDAGMATGVAVGQAKISAASGATNGSGTLAVTDNLVSISLKTSASDVNVGSTLQLTAMGIYQTGSPVALSGVTWTSSAATVATVTSSGLVSGVKGGTVTVSATYDSQSTSVKLTIVPVLATIALNPAGPAVVIGGTQAFQATGIYNDSSTQDLTATAGWTSSDSTKATINSAGTATGVSAGPVEITAAVGSVTATTALNVVSKTYASFSGSYAFTLTSADTRGPSFFAGAITPDGKGNIAGVEDSNTASGVLQNVAISGTYVVYPDGRGTITFNPNTCHPSGLSLRVILTSAGTTGSVIESDTLGLAKGTLAQQNAAAFTLSAINGAYVFRASGIGSGNSSTVSEPVGELGLFSANGAGVISSGLEDVDDYGTIQQYEPLVQSAYSVGTNGRGTLALTTAAGTANYVVYVVDSTRFNLLEIDPSPATAVAGVALLQDNVTFTAANLSGSYAFLMDRPITVENGQSIANIEFGDFGEYTFNAVSAVTGTRSNIGVSGGFAVTGGFVVGQYANGRGTLTTNDCPTPTTCSDERIYVFYMISASKMFILQDYTMPNWMSGNPMVGEADLQASQPYSEATLTGSYVLHTFDPIASNTQTLLWLSMDGTGNISGIADSLQGSSFTSQVITNPYYIYDLNASGTGTIELTTSAGTQDYRMYVVSPQTAWIHGVDPALDGSLDQQ
jgi:uncharacterized protein YjdB